MFGPGTKPDVPHISINPDIMGTEAGGLLKLAGFQTSQENSSSRFRESSCLKEIGRVIEDPRLPLLASLYTHRHIHKHAHTKV